MNKLLKITTIISFALLLFVSTLSTSQTSFAQEANEATTSASEKKIDYKALLVNGVKNVLGSSSEKKEAVIGEVTRVTDETITLNSRYGTRIISTEEVTSITKNDKDIKITDIAVENWITVLGKIIDDNFTPVFLYVYSESILPKTQFVSIGTIIEITKNTITITPRSGAQDETISILTSTDFEDINGVEISLNNLEEDITILVSGYDNESKIEAKTIRSLAPIAEDSESN